MCFSPRSLAAAACFSLAALTVSAHSAPPGVRCVQPDGDNINDGDDWGTDTAWETIEYALAEMNASGGAITEIWIAKGTTGFKWNPPGATVLDSWYISAPVIIRGGFAGVFGEEPEDRPDGAVTVLSGDLGSSTYGDRLVLVELVSTETSGVTFDRLRFEDAGVPFDPMHSPPLSPTDGVTGAAIQATDYTNSNPIFLTDCEFSSNTSSEHGGAIHATDFTILDVRRCVFEENEAYGKPPTTGGLGSPGTDSFGGAISCHGSDVMIVQCTFTGNNAVSEDIEYGYTNGGGAVHLGSTTGDAKFINCEFRGNHAECGEFELGFGGAVHE